MAKKLKFVTNFMPCEVDDEIFRNGVFQFNISKMLSKLNSKTLDIALSEMNVSDFYCSFSRINEEHIDSVDIRKPVIFLYLYMVMDIYSRKIEGWQAHDNESSALASDLMVDICRRENIKRNQVVLHSDNGSPMKDATMLATLQTLGVMPSFSRPSVSNDNPYSESLFRTLKYRPGYPEKKFTGLVEARTWVESFVSWYNDEHCHSGIKFVTPASRHQNKDTEMLAKRHEVYRNAKAKNPERWSRNTRNWTPITKVSLNPNNEQKINNEKAA